MKSELDNLQESINLLTVRVTGLVDDYIKLAEVYTEAIKALRDISRCYPCVFKECVTDERFNEIFKDI